jgi:succinyl-CoA synthetase alpha subunit
MTALDTLLAPASVAVVGASDNPHKVGGRPLRYLLDQGYAGRVYAVNPRQSTVQGLKAHASLEALPEVPDVAVLCVAAEQAEEQLALAARLGVHHALLFASGYAEIGAEGLARQRRLRAVARDGGVRLLGPNTIGIASFDSGAVLSFASIYTDHAPADGAVAIVSQSGAFGVSAYALLRERGLGVRCVAATGNEADLSCADFVDALARRPGVRLLLLYLEGVPDGARLQRALHAARAHGVAVVAVRAARSAAGRRSAHWHTGSGGAADARLDAMFAAAGCRTVSHLDELVASVPLYLDPAARAQAMPPRVAIVSNSGASCVLAADAAERLRLPLAARPRDGRRAGRPGCRCRGARTAGHRRPELRRGAFCARGARRRAGPRPAARGAQPARPGARRVRARRLRRLRPRGRGVAGAGRPCHAPARVVDRGTRRRGRARARIAGFALTPSLHAPAPGSSRPSAMACCLAVSSIAVSGRRRLDLPQVDACFTGAGWLWPSAPVGRRSVGERFVGVDCP